MPETAGENCLVLGVGLSESGPLAGLASRFAGSLHEAVDLVSRVRYDAALVGDPADDAAVFDAISHLAVVAPHLALVAVVREITVDGERELLLAGAQEVLDACAIVRGDGTAALRRALARQHRVAKLGQDAVRDPLTGLLNRRGFDVAAEYALRGADRRGATVAALMLDVDDLKALNDSCGHAAGDEALRRVAGALMGSLRASDVTGRVGGDEFAVLAPGAEAGDADRIVERIVDRLRTDAGRTEVTVSAGWAVRAPKESTGIDVLLRAADAMLYERKV